MNRLILSSLVLLFFSCQSKPKDDAPKAIPIAYLDNKLVVETVHPETRTFEMNAVLTGIFKPHRKMDLYSLETGVLEKMTKNLGDSVRIGDTISVLKNPELWQEFRTAALHFLEAQKNVDLYKTMLENAERDRSFKMKRFDRLGREYGNGVNAPTRNELDTAEKENVAAIAVSEELKIKNAYIHKEVEASQKIMEAYASRINQLYITAPFSGRIAQKYVNENDFIRGKDMAVLELIDDSKMRLRFQISQSNIGEISVGSEMEVTFLDIEKAKGIYKISKLSGFNEANNSFQAEIEIDNTKGAFRAGMVANVKAKAGKRKELISVLKSAVKEIDDQRFVFVLNNGQAMKIPIQTGMTNEDFVALINADLTKESLVILDLHGLVKEGMEVTLKR